MFAADDEVLEVCRAFRNNGKCRYGDECNYAHTEGQSIPAPPRSQCYNWEETGACPYGDRCRYLHGPDDDGSRFERKDNNKPNKLGAEKKRSLIRQKRSGAPYGPHEAHWAPPYHHQTNHSPAPAAAAAAHPPPHTRANNAAPSPSPSPSPLLPPSSSSYSVPHEHQYTDPSLAYLTRAFELKLDLTRRDAASEAAAST